jgi:branched-chain amino acid aminotransferase
MELVNFNGELIGREVFSLDLTNRAFRFGDSIFETIRVFDGKIIFLDQHYSRLIFSLGVMKIDIPKYFTKKYFSSELQRLVNSQDLLNARIRFTAYRRATKSIYFVDINDVFDFVIECYPISSNNFELVNKQIEVGVYTEIRKPISLLSQIKTNNVLLHSIAGSVAKEKGLDNILLVNDNNCIAEAVNANVFFVKEKKIVTPKISDGCVSGVMRNFIIQIIEKDTSYTFDESSINIETISDFDEVFLTNSIIGVHSVDKILTKRYKRDETSILISLLKNKINLILGQKES